MSPRNTLYVLNSAEGGATEGIIQLLEGLRGSEERAFVVIPDARNLDRVAQIRQVAEDVAVVPMSWWDLKDTYPWWFRPMLLARTNLRTHAHVRPTRALAHLIELWDIDLVYTSTALILDGALAAKMTSRPHLWHVKESLGRRGRVHLPMTDAAMSKVMAERLSDRLICMTEFIATPFRPHVPKERIDVIFDGVDAKSFDDRRDVAAYRRELGIGEDELLIAMAASLHATWKRHDLFVRMAGLLAQRLPTARFVIFGAKPTRKRNDVYNAAWRQLRSLETQAAALNLGDRLTLGAFSSDIPLVMGALDILVHPCDTEPFGRIAIEAMAARRPVVGPAAGGISESVVHEETGLLVRPGDAEALSNAVEHLAADADLRSQMGSRGRARAEEVFSLESHVTAITRLYDQVQAGHSK